MSHEHAWVYTDQCTFSDSGAGLHINNADSNISDSRYDGNIFRNNGTAVLLEQVGADTSLKFGESLFTGSETGIDNCCDQELDLDLAIFQ